MKKKPVYVVMKDREGKAEELARFTNERRLVAFCRKHAAELGIKDMDAFNENATLVIEDAQWYNMHGKTINLDDMSFFLENGRIDVEE